jgi:hypothetical protein
MENPFNLRKRTGETDYEWMDRWQQKLREIGPDSNKVGKALRNLFLWQSDRPMRGKQ